MISYPVPFNEDARVAATKNVPGLTRDNEVLFDTICTTAAKLFDCPIAHISVVEESTQWYKAVIGIDLGEMTKDNSFCTHTIMSGAPLIVPDLSIDPRFKEHPMVADGGPQARYYAGVPLILSSGFRFGSLCVLDFKPHDMPSDRDISVLQELGRAVVAALEKTPADASPALDTSCQDTFMTLVGHELRTPLTVIHGSLRMLESRVENNINRKLVKSASRSSEHLSKLVGTILEFSDARTGELNLNEEATDLTALLDEFYTDHAVAAMEAGKHFIEPSCGFNTSVRMDSGHIKVCLISLLMNSVLHGGKNIGLTVNLNDDGDIEMIVSDDGQISDEIDLADIYKPFTVGGNLMQRGSLGGIGLGLPLTRRLVELHGGRFEVTSVPEGTNACIRLPKWRFQTEPDGVQIH